jgi:hypothetical protein
VLFGVVGWARGDAQHVLLVVGYFRHREIENLGYLGIRVLQEEGRCCLKCRGRCRGRDYCPCDCDFC